MHVLGRLCKCASCNATIYPTEHSNSVWSDGKSLFFHESCFRCGNCGIRLTTSSARSLDGKPFCSKHFNDVSLKLSYIKPDTTSSSSTQIPVNSLPSLISPPKVPTSIQTRANSKFGFVGTQQQKDITKKNLQKHNCYVIEFKHHTYNLNRYAFSFFKLITSYPLKPPSLVRIHPPLLKNPRNLPQISENTVNGNNIFLQLPPEIIAEICSHLSVQVRYIVICRTNSQDILKLEKLCRRMVFLISDNNLVWTQLCKKHGYALDFLTKPIPPKVAWLAKATKFQKQLFMLQYAYHEV